MMIVIETMLSVEDKSNYFYAQSQCRTTYRIQYTLLCKLSSEDSAITVILIQCMFFSSSTRNFIGLLVTFIQDALCVIRQYMHSQAGLSCTPLLTAFCVGACAKPTCTLCVFQNSHRTQCAQRRRAHTSEQSNRA